MINFQLDECWAVQEKEAKSKYLEVCFVPKLRREVTILILVSIVLSCLIPSKYGAIEDE